jgi:hypothetical protein
MELRACMYTQQLLTIILTDLTGFAIFCTLAGQ